MSRKILVNATVREGIELFRSEYEKDDGRDDGGLACRVEKWMLDKHRKVINTEARYMLRRRICDELRRMVQATRPSSREVEAWLKMEEGGQIPMFKEIRTEWYRPGHGHPILLPEMKMRQVAAAIEEYADNERENGLKRRRLQVLYAEMVKQGFKADDRVKKLYVGEEGAS